MPEFVVTKAQDAVALWDKVFVADTAEEANMLADADKYVDGWHERHEHRYFDNCDILTDETEEVEQEDGPVTLTLQPAERDLIIAALRLWQERPSIPPAIVEIACNGRVHSLLDDEIDILIEEKINV